MKTWTKILLAVLSLVMVLSMAACQPAEEPDESSAESTPVETPAASTPEKEETPKPTEPETPKPTEPESSETEPPVQGGEATDFTAAVQGFFTGDLINGKITITNGALSTKKWTGTSLEGYAIMSGNDGENDSTSAIKFPISVTEDAVAKFNLKVDAGADTADYVYIVVDGARHGLDNLYNGEHAVAIPLEAGDHEITIAYRKDATSNENNDAAYMSKVTVEKAPFPVAPTPLELVDEMPEKFEGAEQLNIDDLAYVLNGASKGTTGDAAIVYIKKSHDYPRASIKFTVEEAGTYEILVVTALKNRPTAISTGLVQVDNGQKYYLSSPCKGVDGEPEYFVGVTAELTAGEHDFHMYLAEDFNDGDVKSIYFDYIFVVKK